MTMLGTLKTVPAKGECRVTRTMAKKTDHTDRRAGTSDATAQPPGSLTIGGRAVGE